jgi:hypothetical protein
MPWHPTPPRLPLWALVLPAAALIAGCAGPLAGTRAPASMDAASYAALQTLDYAGSQRALENLDRAIAAAGTDPARVSALTAGLVQVLGRPQVTFAARQAICQRLGQLLGKQAADAPALAVLAPMLSDPRLVDCARLALEPVPGPAVDAVFIRALDGAGGGARLALVQSVGNRRIAQAVPELSAALVAPDAALSEAAARALGSIGTGAALSALESAPAPDSAAVLEARLACIANIPGPAGAEALRAVYEDARAPRAQRAAAWRGLLEREPSAAVQRIVSVLGRGDPSLRQVALESVATLRSRDLVGALSGDLVTFDPPTQAAVIAALARRGDPAAVGAVLAASASADAAVRKAAIAALGLLPGNADVAARLANLVPEAGGEEARLARRSLARLAGPGVNAAVLAGAAGADPRLRAVYMEAIGLRGMTEAGALLLGARSDPDAGVRSAALQALGAIAPADDEGAILAWAAGADNATESAHALRALVSVSGRNPDPGARIRPVIDAIDRGSPQARLRLLPALARIGGADAAACAGRMALLPAPPVAEAATAILAGWPGGAALPQLADAATGSPLAGVRSAALAGSLRVLDRRRGPPASEPTDVIARLLASTADPDARRQLVFLLARGSGDSALALARGLRDDPVLGREARDAALAIRANRDWPPGLKVSAAADQAQNILDGDGATAWSVSAASSPWIQVDFGRSRPVRRVTLDQTGHAGDYPERYEVRVSDDPEAFGPVRRPARARPRGP